MGKALMKGTLFGAIIIFVWLALSWMAIPWHCTIFKQFKDQNSVASVITANATESGNYVLPYMCEGDQQDPKIAEIAKKGPLVLAIVRLYGYDFTSPKPYIQGFIIDLVCAFFVTYLLLQTRIASYWHRVWFVTVFGIAAGIWWHFQDWNWWGFALSYTIIGLLDSVIAWFLAGLAIAAVVPRRT